MHPMCASTQSLLVFFVTALIAYVILRGFELRRQPPASASDDEGQPPS